MVAVTSRAAKTSFTKLAKYNERLAKIKEVMTLIGDKQVILADGGATKTFFVRNNRLKYYYGENYEYSISAKESSTDRKLEEIRKYFK